MTWKDVKHKLQHLYQQDGGITYHTMVRAAALADWCQAIGDQPPTRVAAVKEDDHWYVVLEWGALTLVKIMHDSIEVQHPDLKWEFSGHRAPSRMREEIARPRDDNAHIGDQAGQVLNILQDCGAPTPNESTVSRDEISFTWDATYPVRSVRVTRRGIEWAWRGVMKADWDALCNASDQIMALNQQIGVDQ